MSAIFFTNASGSSIPFVFRQNQRMTLALATHLFISPQNQPLLPVIGGDFQNESNFCKFNSDGKACMMLKAYWSTKYIFIVNTVKTHYITLANSRKEKKIMMDHKWMIIHSDKPKGVQSSGSTINAFAPVLYNPPFCQTVHYYSHTLQY